MQKIYGMDHNYSQLKLTEEEKKRFIFLPEGSQTDQNIFKDCPLFDIIIDDASHIPSLTFETWNILKNKLSSNGVYIIEDVDPNDSNWNTSDYKNTFNYIDLRHIKNKHDDIIYVYYNKF